MTDTPIDQTPLAQVHSLFVITGDAEEEKPQAPRDIEDWRDSTDLADLAFMARRILRTVLDSLDRSDFSELASGMVDEHDQKIIQSLINQAGFVIEMPAGLE